MNILFAQGRMTPPFFYGGAEISNLTLATRLLKKTGMKVSFFGSYTHYQREHNGFLRNYLRGLKKSGVSFNFTNQILSYSYRGINCYMTDKKTYLEKLINFLGNEDVDVVITMLEFAPEIIEICHRLNIKTILWIMDSFDLGTEALKQGKETDLIIFSSNYLKDLVLQKYSRSGVVLYPMFEEDLYKTTTEKGHYMTMINPIPEKGREIFIALAKELPIHRFLAIEGWRPANINGVKNLVYMKRQYDMRIVYGKTKLVIVPSIWPEAFGRIIIEAGISGIPAIASNIGGIPEAAGNGAILINDFHDVKEWSEAIGFALDNYKDLKEAAIENSRKYLYDWTSEFVDSYIG